MKYTLEDAVMKNFSIYKAQPIINGDAIESTKITFSNDIPSLSGSELEAVFRKEAETLEQVLYGVLPGGVYDRLLGLMLSRKSSHYIVAHVEAHT